MSALEFWPKRISTCDVRAVRKSVANHSLLNLRRYFYFRPNLKKTAWNHKLSTFPIRFKNLLRAPFMFFQFRHLPKTFWKSYFNIGENLKFRKLSPICWEILSWWNFVWESGLARIIRSISAWGGLASKTFGDWFKHWRLVS